MFWLQLFWDRKGAVLCCIIFLSGAACSPDLRDSFSRVFLKTEPICHSHSPDVFLGALSSPRLSHLLLWNGFFLWTWKLFSVMQDAKQLSYLQFKKEEKKKKTILNLKVDSTKFLKKYISVLLLYNVNTFRYILEPKFTVCFKYNWFNKLFSALAEYFCQVFPISPEQWVCFQWSPFLLSRSNTGWCFIGTHCKQILPAAKAFHFVTLH